jgi:hypothetical protein
VASLFVICNYRKANLEYFFENQTEYFFISLQCSLLNLLIYLQVPLGCPFRGSPHFRHFGAARFLALFFSFAALALVA